MARRIMGLALIGAILFQGANASLFMDASLEFFTDMFDDGMGGLTLWISRVIYYSFLAPIMAPILGTLIAELYAGSVAIDGVAADEALAIIGLHNEEYAFYFLMNSIGKLMCSALDDIGLTCTTSFSQVEIDFYNYFELDPNSIL